MEKMYFFDSIEGDKRIYQAADFARFHANIVGNGVSNTPNLADLEVIAKTNMEVSVGSGYMFANGYMYENTTSLTLTHDIADVNNDRIDRVVISFDNNPEVRTIKARIIKGTPSSSPVAPAITRTDYIHHMSLAQVRIKAGKSFIAEEDVTDERSNDEVCGYIPLDNIYRGINVSEQGTVSMPNQSYVSVDTGTSLALPPNQNIKLPLVAQIDQQNEVVGTKFYPKTTGAYYIFGYVRVSRGAIPTGSFWHINLFIDGEYDSIMSKKSINGTYDNIHSGMMPVFLEKGQYLEVDTRVNNSGKTVNLTNYRVRIMKGF